MNLMKKESLFLGILILNTPKYIFMIVKSNRYRVVTSESKILEENLSSEEADYLFGFLFFEHGMVNLKIEEYFPHEHLMGRDIDLH